jgi:hypothetical protein
MAANVMPVRPPKTKKTMKPTMKRSGVVNSGRPVAMVMHQAKIWMPLGMTIMRLAAAKKMVVAVGRPVANMWCTQTPKPMKATRSSASATRAKATMRRRTKVGMIEVAMPNAGSTMM